MENLKKMKRSTRYFSEVMGMSYILTGVLVTWMNRFVKIHSTVHLKYVHFTGFKLYLNKIKINLHYLKVYFLTAYWVLESIF